jgi:hypothetical protein
MADLTTNVQRLFRTHGVLDTLNPLDRMRLERALLEVIDMAGGIRPEAAAPFRTPITYTWGPSDTRRQRAAQAGTIVSLSAYAETPPDSGNCIVTLTAVSAVEGEQVLGTCQITKGASIGEAQIQRSIPEGAWLKATPTTANGASGVSISVTQRVD